MDAIAETKIDRSTGEALAHTKYRADIDGLRAVAVLSVLAYHVGFAWIPGGYVGVDIFFVISGYLISAIIQKEIAKGKFSLTGFYARRVCRIFPAFFLMAIVTSSLAYHYFFPFDLERYANSLAAASLSVSNIYFWSVANYFDVMSATQPLLHTWSLGVEEQFYLLLPLLLIAAHKWFPGFRKRAISLLLLSSLGLSCYLVFSHPSATFYLIPTRAWELLAGTVLSFSDLKAPVGRLQREALTVAGVGCIAAAVFGFSATTPFPGAAAVLPCLGAAFIIAAGQSGSTVVGRILSIRPVNFVGRISYSLYLWHWPIVVFQHQYAFLVSNRSSFLSGHPYLFRNGIILIVTFVVSTLSWRFVEQPFRQGYGAPYKFRVLATGAAASAMLIGLSCVTIWQHGFSKRFSPEAIRYASFLGYGQEHFRPGVCFIVTPELASEYDKGTCLVEHPGRPSYLLIGDSMAAQLWYGLSLKMNESDILQATGTACKPTLDQAFGAYAECTKVIDYAFKTFLSAHRVDAVILSARWSETDLPRLARTLAWLKERQIRAIVLGPMVQYSSALPRLLALSIEQNDSSLPDRELLDHSILDANLEKIATAENASYVSMYGLLCHAGTCLKILPGGIPLEFDADHITREGSVVVAQKLVADHVFD